jgi:CBS domain containing-hemolysin-like protein
MTIQQDSRKQRMTPKPQSRARAALALSLATAGALGSGAARASMFAGDALDTAADVLAWVVLIVVPIIGIVLFWLVHILPEKVAEQKRHPQAKAIQVLCLLSLVFGGLLWPLAWLWAYSKPVMYKLAYGTDVADHEHGDRTAEASAAEAPGAAHEEMARLRERLALLESRTRQEARG